MRITFITSGFGLSGGTKAIFELANNLTKRGHEVFVICSLTPFIFADKWFNPFNILTKILRLFKKSKGCQTPVKWFGVRAKLLCVPSFDEKYIPDADIILATWWETAYFVKSYSNKKGEKFYFAQDYEVWSENRENKERAKTSYNLGLKIIVNSTWLKDKLRKEAGVEAETVILHAPDHNQFFPEKVEREDNLIRILMPYREERRKGMKEGLAVIELVKKKYPNIKLVLFDKKPLKENSENEIIKDFEFHLSPVKDELRHLYNSCDIFLYPTLEEGFGMPPMEAMACGIPVVTTTAGAIPEYTIAGETALLSPPGDVKTMAKNIIDLIKNKEKREEIARQGREYIKQFCWERAALWLEEIFKKIYENKNYKPQIDKKLLEIVYCPFCQGNLNMIGNRLICCFCNKKYKIIDNIPVLLNDLMEDDVKLAKEKWRDFYKNFDWEKERQHYLIVNIPYIYRRLSPIKKGDTFLELGSGPSFLSFELAQKGVNVICVDFDLNILKIAKKFFKKYNINGFFVCADISRLPFKNNAFDFSFGGGVIEHSKNIGKSVQEIFRVTKNNGYTFQTVPMLSFFTFFFNLRYGTIPHLPILKQIFSFIHIKILKARHMKYGYEESFTMGFLQKIFKKSGFSKIETGFYDYNQTVLKKNKFLSKIFYKILRWKFFGDITFIKAYK